MSDTFPSRAAGSFRSGSSPCRPIAMPLILRRSRDVILNLRYTARHGGDALRAAAKSAAVLPPRPAQAVAPSAAPIARSRRICNGVLACGTNTQPSGTSFFSRHPQRERTRSPPCRSISATIAFRFNIGESRSRSPRLIFFSCLPTAVRACRRSHFPLRTRRTLARALSSCPLSPVWEMRLTSRPQIHPHRPPQHRAARSWLLQYNGDLSQLALTDIFLLCEFSAS